MSRSLRASQMRVIGTVRLWGLCCCQLPYLLPFALCPSVPSFSTGRARESPGNLVGIHTIGSLSGNSWIRFFVTLTLGSVLLKAPLCCWRRRPRAGSWADSGSHGHQREGPVALFAAWITEGDGVFPLMLSVAPRAGTLLLKMFTR